MNRGSPVAVVGGGAWGTALAIHLARLGHPVGLWIREADLVARMLDRRDNPRYLPGVRVPGGVTPTAEFGELLRRAEVVVAAAPSHHARAVYREMAPVLATGVPLLVATKGIEEGTLSLPADVARQELGADRPVAVLSGPSFAAEVARGVPTAVVVASADEDLSLRLRDLLSSGWFSH